MKGERWILARRSKLVIKRKGLEIELEGVDEAENPEGYWDLKTEVDCFDDLIALLEEILEWGQEKVEGRQGNGEWAAKYGDD